MKDTTKSGDTTQLLGTLNTSECRTLVEQMNGIKNGTLSSQTPNGEWRKENLPQPSDSSMKENNYPKSPGKMTRIMDRTTTNYGSNSIGNKTPLQDQSSHKGSTGPSNDASTYGVKSLQRTPLGDKPLVSHSKNKAQTKLFPTPSELMADIDAFEDSDDENPTITAVGMMILNFILD